MIVPTRMKEQTMRTLPNYTEFLFRGVRYMKVPTFEVAGDPINCVEVICYPHLTTYIGEGELITALSYEE